MPYLRPWRRDGIIYPAFLIKESLILDRGEDSQSPRYRAEAMVGSCIPCDRRQSRSQNLGKPQLGEWASRPLTKRRKAADRGVGDSHKGLHQLRNSVLGFVVKPLTFHNEKPDTKVRRVLFMRRTLFPRFSLRFLEAPTMRRGFEGAPLSFLPRRSDGTQQDRRGREDTD